LNTPNQENIVSEKEWNMSTPERRDQRGSLWRKWDLHFHTPASFDYADGSVTNADIVAGLRAAGVSVVAITDHHTIDVARFEELRRLGGNDLTFFPGIELRCELGGREAIHYIGIFPESVNVRDLWASLQGKLDITPTHVTSKTDERVWVSYEKGSSAIHELGGLVSIHAGKKTNSFENIKNDPPFKQLVKTDILRDCVDILEVQSDSDCRGYTDIVFPSVRFRRPIVVGSDNHDIRNYSTKCPCWIRGDATFEALKHVCCEPDDRVFLGEIPPLLERVAKNRTRYVRSVAIRKVEDTRLSETWFDCEVPLNHGLVAVIGNKGGGKSAFADIIGLLGDSHAGDDFSFLTADKFCKANNNKAKSFTGTMTWESEGTSERLLSDRVTAEVESVKYLPQEYIEGVCNELQEHGGGRFSEELAAVIFSHVEQSDRLNCNTFDELLQYKTAEKLKAVGVRRESLNTLIASLVAQERLSSPSHIQTIKEQIASKKRELVAHDAAKPAEVPKPVEDEAARTATEIAEKQIAELTVKADELRKKLETANQLLTVKNRQIAAADRLTTRLASFETEVSMLKEQSCKDCADLGLSIDDIVKVTIDKSRITEARTAAAEQSQTQSKIVASEPEDSLVRQVAAIEKQMANIRNALAGPSKKHQQYLIELKNWQTRREAIVGSADKDDSLRFYEKQLADCDTAAKGVPVILEQVITKAVEVYGDITALAAVYSDLYAPVQRFIEKHPLAKTQFHMSFETKIVERRFAEDFLSHIAQNRRGSFNGSIEGRDRITGLLRETDFNASDSAADFLRKVWHALHNDLRIEPATPSHVTDQLAKGATTQQLYEHVFGFEYLSPFFTLRWAGKDVQQLSPGERGTLLLVFYLLIDRSDIPLIIDQPEENLDNQTVFNVLVPSIKEARGRRQLIIVTHNPNLAVVCDADQVICASIYKEDGNKVSYDAGAIENPRINKRILDILEGTRPAFDNRDSKYHPQL
jgi:ABC-type lipoprotein export system ATPase subunit